MGDATLLFKISISSLAIKKPNNVHDSNFFKKLYISKKIHVSFEKENLNLTQYQTNCFQKKNKSEVQKRRVVLQKLKGEGNAQPLFEG